MIALHDCDIVNYDRQLLARLCYAIAHPHLPFDFCKGYYARVTDRMHGRVTRLFMTPLIRALEGMAPGSSFLHYLDSFRYALAGEFAMDIDLARVNRIPADWGLEVGVLAEVYRNCAVARTCQVDLTDNYEHKHQTLSTEDPSKGLARMATDIAKSLFTTLAAEGLVFSADHFRSLEVRYVRMAQDTIARYYADAMLNGLKFDRHAEELAVAVFAKSLPCCRGRIHRGPARPSAHTQLEPGPGRHSGVLRSLAGFHREGLPATGLANSLKEIAWENHRLPAEARRAAEVIRRADIVIGIPSYNNARTIGHVVRAAYAGLAKYFPQLTAVVINSDGGSTDDTREAALSARVEDNHLMLLSTPLVAAHRLSFPYHGMPGKGSAFRLVFQMAQQLDAKACAVVDSDLRSITPEWIDLLIRPVLFAGFDFVAPYYQRHKYDGTITNSIVYPLTRMLYGVSVRQPIGGEFGVSARLISAIS